MPTQCLLWQLKPAAITRETSFCRAQQATSTLSQPQTQLASRLGIRTLDGVWHPLSTCLYPSTDSQDRNCFLGWDLDPVDPLRFQL